MEDLNLDFASYAETMAETLAMMHWHAQIDVNDVESVLAPPSDFQSHSSPIPPSNVNPPFSPSPPPISILPLTWPLSSIPIVIQPRSAVLSDRFDGIVFRQTYDLDAGL